MSVRRPASGQQANVEKAVAGAYQVEAWATALGWGADNDLNQVDVD